MNFVGNGSRKRMDKPEKATIFYTCYKLPPRVRYKQTRLIIIEEKGVIFEIDIFSNNTSTDANNCTR